MGIEEMNIEMGNIKDIYFENSYDDVGIGDCSIVWNITTFLTEKGKFLLIQISYSRTCMINHQLWPVYSHIMKLPDDVIVANVWECAYVWADEFRKLDVHYDDFNCYKHSPEEINVKEDIVRKWLGNRQHTYFNPILDVKVLVETIENHFD